MAKTSSKKKAPQASEPVRKIEPPFSWTSVNGLSIILFIITALLFGNTLFNDIALDDGLVFYKNNLVTKGFSGIGDILTHDTFFGAFGDMYTVNGGRYRPLSLVTFAIEYEFLGALPWVSHLINVLLYGFTGILLMKILNRYVFKGNVWLSFFTALLFIVHPVHTEVVANIKSRDEILSLIFLLLTLQYALQYIWKQGKAGMNLLLGSTCYVLALLSKENGLTFVFILPVSLFFFSKAKGKEIFNASLPVFMITIAYLLFRVFYLGFINAKVTELLDNPYLLATTGERFATIFFVFLSYFRLLIFPHPLTYDYSYNQVPYRHFSDVLVIISILIHIGLAWFVFKKWKSKDVLVWCILFYLASMFIVSNIVMNVGTFLAERFLYQSSVAFCIAFVVLSDKVLAKIAQGKTKYKSQLAVALGLIIFIPATAKTVTRNANWKNDTVLFLHDEKISSGSARAATYAAVRYSNDADTIKDPALQREYRLKGLEMCKRSHGIYPNSVSNYFNWGVIYSRLDSMESAERVWNEAQKIKPGSTQLDQYYKYLASVYFGRGLENGLGKDGHKNVKLSIEYLGKAVRYDPTNPEFTYNLGGAYFSNGQYDSAKVYWEKTLELRPDHAEAKKGLGALNKQ